MRPPSGAYLPGIENNFEWFVRHLHGPVPFSDRRQLRRDRFTRLRSLYGDADLAESRLLDGVETAKQTGRAAFGDMVAYLRTQPSIRGGATISTAVALLPHPAISFPGVQRIAPEPVEAHETEQALQ